MCRRIARLRDADRFDDADRHRDADVIVADIHAECFADEYQRAIEHTIEYTDAFRSQWFGVTGGIGIFAGELLRGSHGVDGFVCHVES